MPDAIKDLSSFYRIIQPGDLLGRYITRNDFKGNKIGEKDPLVTLITNLIINTGNGRGSGIITFDEMAKKINEFLADAPADDKNRFHDLIKVFAATPIKGAKELYFKSENGDSLSFDNVMGESQEGLKPRLGVFMSASPFVSQNVRDINKVILFMNTIPTIEFSRAIPFLDVRFQFDRPSIDGETRLRAPSLLKFLNGAFEPKKADKVMADALIDEQTSIDGTKKDVYKSGMELFTAPQPLLNPTPSDDAIKRRFVPVIDEFRPFMSIESFEITAAPTVGLFSYKTAKLNLVLHDRSRLGEISDLVRPEIYTRTTLGISYGWNHPDQIGGTNVYGDLLNQMSIKNEKYGIVNASFSFDVVGQVKISLSLAMKGTQEIRILKIAEDSRYLDTQKELENLSKLISDLRETAGLRNQESVSKEVRVFQILDAAEHGELFFDFKSKEIKDLIVKLQKRKRGASAEAAHQLATALQQVFGDGRQQKGVAEKLKTTIQSAIDEKFTALQEGEDPFLMSDKDTPYVDEIKRFNGEPRAKGEKKGKRIVSLGKLMLVFLGKPFQALGNIDEVQFFYYQFNGQAGKAGDTNIASFPIEINYLRKVFDEHVKEKGNANLTVQEFVLLLQGAIINDPRAIAYGLRRAYTPRTGKNDTDVKAGIKIEDVLSEATAKNGGSFKYPVVEAYIETMGGRPINEGELESEKSSHDIMRIHLFDKQASPYEPFLQMINSQTGLQNVINGQKLGDTNGSYTSARSTMLQLASNAGLDIKVDDATGKITLQYGSFQQIKNFITQILPTITYGSNNTAVVNATLASQQNQLLSTVQMMRTSGRQNTTEPNGSAIGGIPLRIIPSQLDVNTFGCPLLNINQQFFFDMSTGTTVDNIYLLTHLSHTIKQGKFESHMKMVPLDAYGVYEDVVSKVSQLAASLKNT